MSIRKISLLIGCACLSLLPSSKGFSSPFLDHFVTPEILPEDAPWLTGPIIAPPTLTMPPKHVDIEPFLYFTVLSGSYNADWEFVHAPTFYSILEQIPI